MCSILDLPQPGSITTRKHLALRGSMRGFIALLQLVGDVAGQGVTPAHQLLRRRSRGILPPDQEGDADLDVRGVMGHANQQAVAPERAGSLDRVVGDLHYWFPIW